MYGLIIMNTDTASYNATSDAFIGILMMFNVEYLSFGCKSHIHHLLFELIKNECIEL